MFRKILLFIILFNIALFANFSQARAARDCTVLGPSDNNTFKEYCYKITDAYLSFRNKYKVDSEIDTYLAGRILNYAKQGLNYLPDDLTNKNYFTHLQTAIERGIKEPKNVVNFDSISSAIDDFLNKTNISEISGDIEVFPASGNAPLTVTFRGNVTDPTGSQLQAYNYTWWVLDSGKRKNIGNGNFLNYTFREEGNFSVFLDVTSNHKNSLRNSDVIPFSKKVVVSVREKAASVILKINSKNLDSNDELKFTPEESVYGLIFDATSSTPTSGTKFISTEWDFGNGVVRKNEGAPRVERVVYATEGEYRAKMKLTTNTGKVVERNFGIIIRNPIASINANNTEGFLGDKFTFTANSYNRNENLNYTWEIVDLKNDKILFSKSLSTLSYTFPEKGRYNVKLSVVSPSGVRDYDNKIIHINSRPPIATFVHTIPNLNKPNTVFLDASSSYDLDFGDDGKLEYSWIINGDRVDLTNPNFNGSSGYFTFENIGEQSVSLEVRDPDDLVGLKTGKININSNLSVDFYAFPRVSQVGEIMKFTSDAPKAQFYEWDFGDGNVIGGKDDNITHKYSKAGIYKVRLIVRDENDFKNTVEKIIYIGDAEEPLANIKISGNSFYGGEYGYREDACNGNGAYIVNKIDNVTFSGSESIDVTGLTSGLDYSWKIGDRFYSSADISRRFDDTGCVPVKLTVKSKKNGKESVSETYLKVENLKPTLTGLDIQVKDISTDPVIVDVKALGASDRDGVIQSYLWYYYTDVSSEPQDFRATRTGQTTFVLPKITGTYYFVAVLKDNSEERVSSDELDSKYFITLSGDNVNTPIVALSANNSSVKAGDEVVFTASVSNILGQDLTKEAKYAWDFDGDGFYDLETSKNVVSHKFTKSGEFRIKVKVKNKGFSNTKTISVNVSNILKPDFSYISIGNSYIFFDKSSGNIESYSWDMGDGEKLDKKGSFFYTYSDGKPSHIVKLTVFEGTNKKEISHKIVRDFKQMISSKKEALAIYSNYAINNDKIIFKEEVFDLQIFLKTNLEKVTAYAVDFDVETDSDLNGGKEDDEDNKNTTGYTSGGPIKIELNNKKVQKIKVFLKDESGKILETKNLTIEKEYIKEEKNISSENIKLDGVPESVKNSFNKIKEEVMTLDEDSKYKSLTYLQKLQEEWADARERTNIIIEFSNFILELNPKNVGEITSLLEGMLVDENDKQNENAIVLSALKNLIPRDVVCPAELASVADSKKISCYDLLASKLQTIYENNNAEENKVLGKEILSALGPNKTMTDKQKVDFKTLLSKLINKGSEPTAEEAKEIDTTVSKNNDSSKNTSSGEGGILSSILGILLWIVGILFGVFVIGGIIYFISYKLKANKENQSFTDYVAEKTNNIEKEDVLSFDDDEKKSSENNFDPLSDEVNLDKNSGDVPSWLKGSEQAVKNEFSEDIKESKKEEVKTDIFEEKGELEKNDGEIPSWLSGHKVEEKLEETIETPSWMQTEPEKVEENFSEVKEEKVEETGEIPSWLQTEPEKAEENFSEVKEEKVEETGEIPSWLQTEPEKAEENFSEVKEEKVEETGEIPSWMQTEPEKVEENFSEVKEEKVEEVGEIPSWLQIEPEKEEEPRLETEEELNEFTKLEIEEEKTLEDDIPEWLKTSISSEKETKEEKVSRKSSDDFSNFDSLGGNELIEEKPKIKKTTRRTKKDSAKNSKKTEKKAEEQKVNEKKDNSDKDLWDDGMKIPDWLKSDDEK